jgi:excinuclease ABC subunit A
VIAVGTPEEVAAEPASYTGRFLAGMLEVKAKRGRKPRAKSATTSTNGSANGSSTRRRASAGKR